MSVINHHPRNILVLFTDNFDSNIKTNHAVQICTSYTNLKNYLYDNVKRIDDFHLHITEQYLQNLLEDRLEQIEQVRRIHIHNGTFQSNENSNLKANKYFEKFNFCRQSLMDSLLENAETHAAIDTAQPIDRNAITNLAVTRSQRLIEKRRMSGEYNSSKSKRHADKVQRIGKSFICPTCNLFFKETYQLACGDRICKSCLDSQDKYNDFFNRKTNRAVCFMFIDAAFVRMISTRMR